MTDVRKMGGAELLDAVTRIYWIVEDGQERAKLIAEREAARQEAIRLIDLGRGVTSFQPLPDLCRHLARHLRNLIDPKSVAATGEAFEKYLAEELPRVMGAAQPDAKNPLDYWRCFHCDFATYNREEAEAHFGDRDDAEEFKPICKWWVTISEDDRVATLQDYLQQLNYERMENYKLEKQLGSAGAAQPDPEKLAREVAAHVRAELGKPLACKPENDYLAHGIAAILRTALSAPAMAQESESVCINCGEDIVWVHEGDLERLCDGNRGFARPVSRW